MNLREKERVRLTSEKLRPQKLMALEERDKLVLKTKGRDVGNYSVPDLNAVLSWHQVKKIASMSKEEKRQKWVSILERNAPPPTFEQWTIDDKTMLQEASQADLEIGDTALGRLEKKRKRDLLQAATKMTEEEWAELVMARTVGTNSTTDNNTAINGGKN